MAARAAMIGADVEVPCVDGRMRRYVNLDYAASTPAMAGVLAAVEEFLPWYSSVHRGSGYKSQLATALRQLASQVGGGSFAAAAPGATPRGPWNGGARRGPWGLVSRSPGSTQSGALERPTRRTPRARLGTA